MAGPCIDLSRVIVFDGTEEKPLSELFDVETQTFVLRILSQFARYWGPEPRSLWLSSRSRVYTGRLERCTRLTLRRVNGEVLDPEEPFVEVFLRNGERAKPEKHFSKHAFRCVFPAALCRAIVRPDDFVPAHALQ